MDNDTNNEQKKIPDYSQPVNYQQSQTPPPEVQINHNQSQNLNPEVDRVNIGGVKSFYKKHSGLFSLAQLIAGALLLAALINSMVFQSYQVFGHSMDKTLHEGDRLIISKVAKSFSKIAGDYVPARGDIIVFVSPISPDLHLIKRVIALPGERVTVIGGEITVYNDEFPNGFKPDDAYREKLPDELTGNIETVVSEDEVFVSGDNRVNGASLDSRNELGNVPIENITGELVFRLFPLDQVSFF